MALNPHLYTKMAYDWDKDLQPITLLVKVPNVMAVNMDVPAKNVAEFIAYAKQNDGKLTFSSSGVGNPQQLTGEMFNKMAGVQIRHVPYKGAAPQIADVAGKHITMTFVSIGAALPFIEGNRIRPIGVTSLTRVSALPDVPAIAEYPPLAGFELVNFFGFFAPAGTAGPGAAPAERRRGAGAQDAGPRRAKLQGIGLRARADHAGAVPRVHPRRIRQVREDHRRSRHQARAVNKWGQLRPR